MSTRANIVIKHGREKLTFYKHSDGYPEGTMPILTKFIDLVNSGEIRDNVGQAAGWLIELGRQEFLKDQAEFVKTYPSYKGYSWKIGYIEPTTCIHGDIEYLYTVDLKTRSIKVKEV